MRQKLEDVSTINHTRGRRLQRTALGLDRHCSVDARDPAALEFPVPGGEGIVVQLRLPRQTPHRLQGAEMIVPVHILAGDCVSLINKLSVFQL